MGNLNDLLVSGDQTSTAEDSGAKQVLQPSLPDLTNTQTAHMDKISPSDDSIKIDEIEKAPDKASVVYAPKKRFLKDYQTGESVNDVSKIISSDKVSSLSNISRRDSNIVKPSYESLNISSCIGVIVESELTKYEMCKENDETHRPNKTSVLPLLFTPYSDDIPDNHEDKSGRKSQTMPNLSNDKYLKTLRTEVESPNNLRHDVEIIACSPEILNQQRHDKVKSSDSEKSIPSSSKLRILTSYETSGGNKSYSPKSYRASPMSASQGSLPQIPQNTHSFDEWRSMLGSEKSYTYQNSPYRMRLLYPDLRSPKDFKSQSQIQFKTPNDPNQCRRMEGQITRHQSPREMSSNDSSMTFVREDVQGYPRGIDPRFYQNLSSEKYAHQSLSSPQMRNSIDETPIDLRVKKREKPLAYGNVIPYELESKRPKFQGYSQDQSIKTTGHCYYLPADIEKGHHSSSLPYNPSNLKAGEADSLKTYLSDQYSHSFNSRHIEPASKSKQMRSDIYPYRELYVAPKVSDENLGKSQMIEKWERVIPRNNDQSRAVSRRQQEIYDHDLSSHYLKYLEANRSQNQDSKSSSPRLIPQLLPISPMNHSKNNTSQISHVAQNFQCKLCNSVHCDYRSFRMHVAKDHSMEPHPEYCALSLADPKSYDRTFLGHKSRQDVGGLHSTPKQVAEVYPIISKVPSSYSLQGGLSYNADTKNKNLEKNRNDIKANTNRDGLDDPNQVLSWDCRHQLVIDSEMNCTTCMEGFQDITDWRAHISSMHMVRSCACRTCNKWFANAEELNRHLQRVHPEHRQVDVEYNCLYCRKAFTDEEVLYIHTREHERTLSISRTEGRIFSKGETEIQKAIPDTTCPESDQKTLSDICDVASTISPTSDCDQEKFLKSEDSKTFENWKGYVEGDSEKTPSSKKSFFLKKFQLEEMSMASEPEFIKNKAGHSDSVRSNEKTPPIPHPKMARSVIDNLVSECLTKNISFGNFPTTLINQSKFLEGSKSYEGSQEVYGQSAEILLSSSEHSQKQPLLKDMLLQINSKSHFPFGTETKLASTQPRTKCVRDICDEIIAHSFRESSPVGPTERLKIFDSIAFDTISPKVESPPCSKSSKGAAISSSSTPTDSIATTENKLQDAHQSFADSTDKVNTSTRADANADSKQSPKLHRQSSKDFLKVPNESDADSTCKSISQKDGRTVPTQSILGKRTHPVDGDGRESNPNDSSSAASDKNDDTPFAEESEEPPTKKAEL